jgi:hypothetical protein
MTYIGGVLACFGATAVLFPATAVLVAVALPKSEGRTTGQAAKHTHTVAHRMAAVHAVTSEEAYAETYAETLAGTGRDRRLIDHQRARVAAAYAHQNPAPNQSISPQDAFDEWFVASFFIPNVPSVDDVALWDDWSTHYVAYCAHRNWPPLSQTQMIEAIKSFADAYGCQINLNTGDFIGGYLK